MPTTRPTATVEIEKLKELVDKGFSANMIRVHLDRSYKTVMGWREKLPPEYQKKMDSNRNANRSRGMRQFSRQAIH